MKKISIGVVVTAIIISMFSGCAVMEKPPAETSATENNVEVVNETEITGGVLPMETQIITLSDKTNDEVLAMTEQNMQYFSADNENITYVGRITHSDAGANMIWSGSSLRFGFEGNSIAVKLDFGTLNGCYFKVIIDGQLYSDLKCEMTQKYYLLAENLSDGVHEIELFKRTEMESVTFGGVYLDENCNILPTADKRDLKLEVYGDSITVGAYIHGEDPNLEWNLHLTDDCYYSYGNQVAKKMNADFVCSGISGTGVSVGWNQYNMPDLWNKTTGFYNSEEWDFSKWQADAVIINLGQNDTKSIHTDKVAFPMEDYQTKYVALVKGIREKYPDAKIFCIIAGMQGVQTLELKMSFNKATEELMAEDENVFAQIFTDPVSGIHPPLENHTALADQIYEFVNANM